MAKTRRSWKQRLPDLGAVANRTYRVWECEIGVKNRKLNRPEISIDTSAQITYTLWKYLYGGETWHPEEKEQWGKGT